MTSTGKTEIVLQGLAASPGVAHGFVFLLHQQELEIPSYIVPEAEREAEYSRFDQAILETRRQISQTRSEVAERLGETEAQIFDAHLLVLDDKALLEETTSEFEKTGFNIEYCFHSVAARYMDAFSKIDDPYIKERVSDIRDVTRRLLKNLSGRIELKIHELGEERVIVSEDMTPSETAGLEDSKVLGIATDLGGSTSHVVIMARSLEIPTVVGLHTVTESVNSGDQLLIDGYEGLVVVNPSAETLERYGKIRREHQQLQKAYYANALQPARTLDGHSLIVRANIEGYEDMNRLKESGAEGVGLYRTEAIFLKMDGFPSEREQFEAYRHVVEDLNPQPVIIRTLDLGGDKGLVGEPFPEAEDNPFMGFRAIRFCLDHSDLFKNQLRAILRASACGNVKILYPMISGISELIQAKALLAESKEELRAKGEPFDPDLEEGVMIEIPSAACTADLLAAECHFFSIGTNDLIQYLLAVDRVNDHVAHLFDPNHPAVIRTIRNIIEAGHEKGIPVSICGEVAGDPLYAPLLFGLGADELSATPGYLPEIKYLIRKMKFSDARLFAREVLKLSEAEEISAHLKRFHSGLAERDLGD